MVLDFDKITVNEEWRVEQKQASIFTRVYWVLSGEVVYSDSDCSMKLQSNHVYLFPTTIGYKMEQNVSDKLSCLFMHLDIAPFCIPAVIELNPDIMPFIKGLLMALDSLVMGNTVLTQATLIETASAISDALICWLRLEGLVNEDFKSLKPAVEHIATRFSEAISIDELSGLCGYHPKYFISVFKSVFGISPYKYIINYRLKIGCSLLKAGKSVEETTSCCGYNEAKSFCRAFKLQYGISPVAYAKGGIPLP